MFAHMSLNNNNKKKGEMVFRYFPIYYVIFSLWLFLRKNGFCVTHLPFFPSSCFPSYGGLPFTSGLSHPLACCMIVTEASVALPMFLLMVSPAWRTPPRCHVFFLLHPAHCVPLLSICVSSTLWFALFGILKGFPLPLSGFSSRNPSRFWLRHFSCFFLLQSQLHPQVVNSSLRDPF